VKTLLRRPPFGALLLVLLVRAHSVPTALAAALPDEPFTGTGPWIVRASFGTEAARREVASWGDHFAYDRAQNVLRLEVDRPLVERLRALGFFVELDAESTALLRHAEAANRRAAAMRALGEPPEAGIPGFPCYRTVEETYASAQALVAEHPTLASWSDIGDSWDKATPGGPEGYDLMVLKLTNTGVAGPKPILFVNAAIHAREYTTAELVTRFAEELVGGYGVDADATWLLDFHELHLLLQTNPDGRKRAEGGLSWRKNVDDNFCSGGNNRGVDLNRNFSFQWNCCGGSSSSPCEPTFHGPLAGSEPEVQAVQSYIQAIFPDQRGPGFPGGGAPEDATGVYLDIHSFSQLVLWPWGGTPTPTDNGAAFVTLGRRFAWFTGYFPEQAVDLYPTDGTTIDFAYGELGVAALTFELGNAFFEACSSFESSVLPANLATLRYAARVARTPFLTPAGPEVRGLTLTPGVAAAGEPATLQLTADDTPFSNANGAEAVQAISAAEAYLDVAPWQAGASALPLVAADGLFDTPVEAAELLLDTTALAPGRHIVYARGQDASGAWGPVSARFLHVLDPATAPFLEGTVRESGTLAPLAATVTVGPFVTATAPDTGAYSMQLPPGTYDIAAASPGHAPRSVADVALVALATVTEEFLLPTLAPVLADDGEGTNPGWTAAGSWALTSEAAASPTHSWSDSPGGNYGNNVDASLTSPVIDLSQATDVALDFRQIYDLEEGYDYGRVEISTTGGASWAPIASVNGEGHVAAWEEVHLPLPALDGSAQARIRFRLLSDGFLAFDGWHLDDIALRAVLPPPTVLFSDGFESGTLTLWSGSVP
jgi:carboxypeptidase T